MTIHAFPVERERGVGRNPTRRPGADRVELVLVVGLIVGTVGQFALVALFWLT